MIKYLGSKRRLLPLIERTVTDIAADSDVVTVLDLFSGTARVGQGLKRLGYRVLANDHTTYAHTLARCYVEADADDVLNDAAAIIAELNALPGKAGWFTELYSAQSRFIQPGNAARIEAAREHIVTLHLPPVLEAVVLTSLMEAADRVDSTVGVQMAYLKQWSRRSQNALGLRLPELIKKTAHAPSAASQLDAADAAATLVSDVAYLDPPYNRHSYLSNYHIWETLVAWDEPEVYGIAKKRVDCKTRKSAFNTPSQFKRAFGEVIDRLQTKAIVVSFSNEGVVGEDDIVEMLSRRGPVRLVAEQGYQRYVGARIGIHSPAGVRVGEVSHTENVEYLFVVNVETPALTMPTTS